MVSIDIDMNGGMDVGEDGLIDLMPEYQLKGDLINLQVEKNMTSLQSIDNDTTDILQV